MGLEIFIWKLIYRTYETFGITVIVISGDIIIIIDVGVTAINFEIHIDVGIFQIIVVPVVLN